ncbi:hypothetical protein SL054_001963 [Flavobacterium psychrophilum]|uniref:hypothetical protein n=1 Tax=Flavobacterium psychrophilum TaxID=96345 RepID=UPI001C8F5DF0|nr:hypothetical protein [Flavobacterium psychrophilum]EKT4498409.1 hypothetical protein [Flavobacterium psychrophilum]ELM3649554.1 hypothetical protein [Flavobacterium psychrophilum]ELM3670398.1 hypothetical protein [Flavobacterium psychrophilum]ELM3725354.1 hypothetical protein [Flavobacterium psychrophilum]ELY1992613.1 hypothetical protein [Flavobacterium psychrophilum]
MNNAHLHMVVNHFPIIGIIFGFGILISGIFIKNNTVKNTAYFVFIVSAIFAFTSMYTGDGAEEMVEDMPNIGKKIIHIHEEWAEKSAIVLYILGAISIGGLYLNLKKQAKANFISFLVLIIAIAGVILAKFTGTSGGEIRHTEIRTN